jgi:hypothetical protein
MFHPAAQISNTQRYCDQAAKHNISYVMLYVQFLSPFQELRTLLLLLMDQIKVTPSGTAKGLTEDTVDTCGSVVANLLPYPWAST